MRNLVASKPFKYATRRLRAGDGFVAQSNSDARALVALGKARAAPRAPVVVAAVAVSNRDVDIDDLRAAYLERKGEDADGRWGVARLRRELGIEG